MPSGFRAAIFSKHAARVKEVGYSILERFANDILDAEVPGFITGRPSKFPLWTFPALHDGIFDTFKEECISTAIADRDLWTPIVNTGNGTQDEAEARPRDIRYSFSKQQRIETPESTPLQWMTERLAALDEWIAQFAAFMDLEKGNGLIKLLAGTGGRYLLTAADFEAQVEYSDVHVCKRFSPCYFVIVNENRSGKFYECKGSNQFVFYPHSERRKLADISELDAIKLPPFSVFIVHGYMQHAGAEYLGHTSLSYHVYLFSNDITLHYSNIFAYNFSIFISPPRESICANEGTEKEMFEDATVDFDTLRDYSSNTIILSSPLNISSITGDTHIWSVGKGQGRLHVSAFETPN